MTREETCATFQRGEEIKLQRLCMNWLLLHDIYFEWDRPIKRYEREKGPGGFSHLFQGAMGQCRMQGNR